MRPPAENMEQSYKRLVRAVANLEGRPNVSPLQLRAVARQIEDAADDLAVVVAHLAAQGVYVDTAWQDLPVTSAWTRVVLGGQDQTRVLRRAGRATVNLNLTRPASATATDVASLTAGFRPGLTHIWRVGFGTADAELKIEPSGLISVSGYTAAAAGLMATVEYPVAP